MNDPQITLSFLNVLLLHIYYSKNENIHSVSDEYIIWLMRFYSMQNSNLILFLLKFGICTILSVLAYFVLEYFPFKKKKN